MPVYVSRKACHEESDAATIADEMLENGCKLDHFIEVFAYLIDGNEKPRIRFGQLTQGLFHAYAPGGMVVVGTLELDLSEDRPP